MKSLTTISWAALALAIGVSLTACGGAKEIEKAEENDVLTVLRGDVSAILDPHGTSSGGDANLIQQMYEGLVRPSFQAPVSWEPCLAESYEISSDFKTYTYKLREGVKFHDGTTLDSAAVKRSYDRGRMLDDKGNPTDPAAPPQLPYAGDYFSDIVSIETPDDLTVVFKLKDSNPKFLSNCGLFSASIISSKAIKHMEGMDNPADRQGWLTRHPAGTGPYTIASEGNYKSAETITMNAFEDYWGEKASIPIVVFKQAKDQKGRREQMLAGEVQMITDPAPADWEMLEKNEDITLYSWKAENLCYLGLNVDADKNFPTANLDVRKAIAMCVNREPLVALYDGTAVAHHVLLPPVMDGFPKGYKPSTDTGPLADRIEAAKKLVKEAGFEGAQLNLVYPSEQRPYLGKPGEIADLLRQQIEQIGLKVKLDPKSLKEVVTDIANGAAPLVLIGWMGETGQPDDFWRPLLSGGNGRPGDSNTPRFYDPAVAAKLDEALKDRDPAKRRAIYETLEKTVHEKQRPMVPLLSAMQAVAWRNDVEGLFVDSTGTYRLYKAKYKGK